MYGRCNKPLFEGRQCGHTEGGSEAINSNRAIVNILRDIAKADGIHEGAITFIDIPEREAVMEMLKLEGIIDLIIPRGGEGLIRTVTENSRIPVLKHYKGGLPCICRQGC